VLLTNCWLHRSTLSPDLLILFFPSCFYSKSPPRQHTTRVRLANSIPPLFLRRPFKRMVDVVTERALNRGSSPAKPAEQPFSSFCVARKCAFPSWCQHFLALRHLRLGKFAACSSLLYSPRENRFAPGSPFPGTNATRTDPDRLR